MPSCFSYLLLILGGSFFNRLALLEYPRIVLLVMYKTKKQQVVAYMQFINATVATGIILNLSLVQFHATEVIFMGIVVLYSFITLTKIVGMVSLLRHGFVYE
jgi:hypothetical protein